ncbi:MAG: single-stranded DNA-binding protein, partial [Clostridia bacterium]|nr:single-stranded DNA-binding protein [Clostridia bacterium]
MLNCVALMGRLVANPELKQTQSGIAVMSFTIACDRSYCKAGEERQAVFIDCTAWRGTAEFICKYFGKGQLIAVQGELQTRSYTDRDGNKRKVMEVIVSQAHFAESKKESNNNTYQAKPKEQPQNTQPAPDIPADDTGDF